MTFIGLSSTLSLQNKWTYFFVISYINIYPNMKCLHISSNAFIRSHKLNFFFKYCKFATLVSFCVNYPDESKSQLGAL